MTGLAEPGEPRVSVIGSALIDDIYVDTELEYFLGGTGFNLAMALASEGVPTALAARIGRDDAGAALATALHANGVQLLVQPDAADTRHASTRITDGEPRYRFDSTHRRVTFTPELIAGLHASRAIAVNSFPFESDDEVARLAELLRTVAALRIIDPNPRPGLVADAAVFADNLDQLLADTDIVKISQLDLAVLDRSLEQMLSGAVQVVFLTKGADGAEILTRAGRRYSAPAAQPTLPLVDTIGAGDAALAGLLAAALRECAHTRAVNNGDPQSALLRTELSSMDWHAHLVNGMSAAAACCQHHGGPAHIRVPLGNGNVR